MPRRRAHMPRACLAGWLALLGMLLPGRAMAQHRVAPLVPRLSPPASVEVVERLQARLAEALGRVPRVSVVPATEVRLAQSRPELLACNDAACLQRLASVLGSQRLVAADVRAVGKTYTVVLRLFDELGAELGRAERQCRICTLREVEDTIEAAAADLEPRLVPLPVQGAAGAHQPATLPASGPASAAASRGGGSASARGPVPWAEPEPPASAPARREALLQRARHWNWKAIGLVAAGTAVVGLAAGIPLLAVDGNPTCGLPDARTTCPRVYATAGGGGTLLGLGILAAAVGGTSFYLHFKWRDVRLTVDPAVLPRSAGVGARMEF